MPASFEIACSDGSYRVGIESGLAAKALARSGDTIILHDAYFTALAQQFPGNSVAVVAEETNKSLDAMPAVISRMRDLGVNRKTHLIAVGGGITQDIAAFCATVFMRGLTWSYLPTTMLSMADSCIGGKSSINVGKYKNLVGMIYPPEEVLIDPNFARTLSDEQMVEGLCEAVKICFCKDVQTFERYIALNPMPGMPARALEDVLGLTLEAKRWFIEVDEFDKAERLLLNFGHTFGHAIESATNFRISHGTAVGMGMLCAIALGTRLGRNYAATPRVARLREYTELLLATVPDKDKRLAGITAAQCFELCRSDKKHEKDNFVFITIGEDGLIERLRLPKTADNSAILTAAFADILAKYQS